jgi:hypothetical protein
MATTQTINNAEPVVRPIVLLLNTALIITSIMASSGIASVRKPHIKNMVFASWFTMLKGNTWLKKCCRTR